MMIKNITYYNLYKFIHRFSHIVYASFLINNWRKDGISEFYLKNKYIKKGSNNRKVIIFQNKILLFSYNSIYFHVR